MEPSRSSRPHLENRVASSKSTYVSSQAGSPVAWQLLDDDAVSRAKAENKMIFLNIGYNACHYCRLMMTEAFSNPQCAELLNTFFIPILVDREERPDIDTIYMNYVQAVNGTGGWPLNLFLTPDLAPVFGGAYWPGPGSGVDAVTLEAEGEDELDFLVILKKLRNVWQEQEPRCRAEASDVLVQLREFAAEGTLGRGAAPRPQYPAATIPPSATMDMHSKSGPTVASPTRSPNPTPEPGLGPTLEATHTLGGAGVTIVPGVEAVPGELDLDQLEEAYTHIAGTFDPIDGGFGIAPKFPTPAKLSFLLKLSHLPREVQHVVGEVECATAHEMTLFTLRKIRDGGLRDHVGGQGLSRYSVTSDWGVPHFEKLMVDNALLLTVYLDAWLSIGATKRDEFMDIVVELADYLCSEPITLPGGGLASSEAADSYSEGGAAVRDGAYQLWTKREFYAVLGTGGEEAATVAAAHWNVQEHGNVDAEQDPNDEFMNRNVLRVVKDAAELSRQFKLPVDEVKAILAAARVKLAAHRARERTRPQLDDKVIAGWNGLGIGALARVALGMKHIEDVDNARYLDAAVGAARFVRSEMWDEGEKRLYRVYRGGRGDMKGLAEDYAYMIEGLLELYQATLDEEWLKWADELQEIQIELFYDTVNPTPAADDGTTTRRSSSGGFYSTEASCPHTILRLKDGMDTSLPSTNAVSAWNLFRLGSMLLDARYTALAKETVGAFEAEMLQYPWLFPGLLAGVVASRLGGRNWVVVGGEAVEKRSEKIVEESEEETEEGEKGAKKGAERDAPKGAGKEIKVVKGVKADPGKTFGSDKVSDVEGNGGGNGQVALGEFFKALDVTPKGELRALVSVGAGQEWVATRRGGVKEAKDGGSGVYCCEGDGRLRKFTKGDLVALTRQG